MSRRNPSQAPISPSALSEFETPLSAPGGMLGAFIASHAIPDSFFLMHTGVGCKLKGQSRLEPHDWLMDSHTRQCHTEITDLDLIRGSAGRIFPYARTWVERRNSRVIVLVSSTVVDMTGDDLDAAAKDAEARLGLAVLLVPTPGSGEHLWQGYAKVLDRIARRVPASSGKPPQSGRPAVGIWGNFFDRYEGDCMGDVAQLDHLVTGILGCDYAGAALCGQPYATLERLLQAPVLGVLPYAGSSEALLRERLGADRVLSLPLPLGLRATRRCVEILGPACASDPDAARRRLDTAAQRLAAWPRMREKLGDSVGAIIAADAPLAAALAGALDELGIDTRLVCLLDGGDWEAACARQFADTPRPAVGRVLATSGADSFARELQQALTSLRAPILLAPSALHALAGSSRVAALDVSFPRYREHGLADAPLFGVAGLEHLAGRVSRALMRSLRTAEP